MPSGCLVLFPAIEAAGLRSLSSYRTPITTWNYDAYRGLLTNKAYADGLGPNYTYTGAGRLKTRAWVRGITTTYVTNSLGETVTADYSDSTPDVAYSLDRLGRRMEPPGSNLFLLVGQPSPPEIAALTGAF